jgi:hypothetical protein
MFTYTQIVVFTVLSTGFRGQSESMNSHRATVDDDDDVRVCAAVFIGSPSYSALSSSVYTALNYYTVNGY